MQMTVSNEIENRIDDSSSTAERRRCEGVARCRPWVETVMGRFNKKGGDPGTQPRELRLVVVCAGRGLVPGRRDGSAQAGDVIGDGADFPVVQLGGDLRHLRAVLAGAVTEGRQ